jgi:type IV pilus assembly protein PilC
MVRSGEAGGVLEEALERISDQLEKDDSLRRQVKSAMAYPVVVFSFAALVLIGMIAFIVPVFVGVFKDFGGELRSSPASRSASRNSHGQWYIPARRRDRSFVGFASGSPRRGAPAVGGGPFPAPDPVTSARLCQKIALARWSRPFSALYCAGVPIMHAIEVTGQTAGNAVVDRAKAA